MARARGRCCLVTHHTTASDLRGPKYLTAPSLLEWSVCEHSYNCVDIDILLYHDNYLDSSAHPATQVQ